ncbi:putative short-chain dehydrogenase/reductase family protein [Biscogniauxia mediterranea]|nr:putative short-chain dehydrogenase/reductase family protein [Biscogniauxia mediterranea]
MSSKLQSAAHFEGTALGVLSRQFTRPKPLPEDIQLTDQVAIVTGSNVGIGFEASRQLLRLGLSHLIMGVRSQTRGDAAADALRREFPESNISVWLLDHESYDSIRAFVSRCETLPRIDFAILNAAVAKQNFTRVSATGHETMMQVNYLSTALLTLLLLPILKAKGKATGGHRPPVISLVGSDTAYTSQVDLKDSSAHKQVDNPEGFNQMAWYGKSKLLLTFFIITLASHVDPNDVLVNMVNPGLTRGTDIKRELPSVYGAVLTMLYLVVGRSAAVAATTYVDAVVAHGPETHGCFLGDWGIKPYPEVCYTEEGKEFAERLWEETIKELDFAGVRDNLLSMKN